MRQNELRYKNISIYKAVSVKVKFSIKKLQKHRFINCTQSA